MTVALPKKRKNCVIRIWTPDAWLLNRTINYYATCDVDKSNVSNYFNGNFIKYRHKYFVLYCVFILPDISTEMYETLIPEGTFSAPMVLVSLMIHFGHSCGVWVRGRLWQLMWKPLAQISQIAKAPAKEYCFTVDCNCWRFNYLFIFYSLDTLLSTNC